MIPGKCFVIVVDESLDLVSVALQEVRHQDVRTELRGRDDVADGRAAAFGPEWMISVELVGHFNKISSKGTFQFGNSSKLGHFRLG